MVYLTLFHGRNDPSINMDGWGYMGPTFAADFISGVYTTVMRLHVGEEHQEILYYDNMLFYDGSWYGDWFISSNHNGKVDLFDKVKALPSLPDNLKPIGEYYDEL